MGESIAQHAVRRHVADAVTLSNTLDTDRYITQGSLSTGQDTRSRILNPKHEARHRLITNNQDTRYKQISITNIQSPNIPDVHSDLAMIDDRMFLSSSASLVSGLI